MKTLFIPTFTCMIITLTACQVTSAKDSMQGSVGTFSVKSKCVSWLGDDCKGSDIIKTNTDGSQEVLMENYPHTYVDKLSNNLYQVKYSCGNYCSVYGFYSALKSDTSDITVALDPESQCLVEIDWGKDSNIILSSRKLFNDTKTVIYQSSDLYPSATLGSKVISAEFISNKLTIELLNKDLQNVNVTIENVCE